MADHAGAGSAKRFRSWWRHERMSIAAALAEALHHSSGTWPSKYDTRVVEDAQHGAVRGQKTATRARGPGTQYFTFDDEDVPGPQVKELQRVVDAPSLDVPALHMVEEVDADMLARLALPEQMIVQELPEVPCTSPVMRVLQPMDVEQVLIVPALHIDEDDSYLNEFLKFVQEIPVVQASSSAAMVVQEQVIVLPLPDARVPRQRVQQRTVEQVADSRVLPAPCGIVEQLEDVPEPGRSSSVASERNVERVVDVPVHSRVSSVVSESIVEQVMDVPFSRSSPSRRAHSQQFSSSSAAALDASPGPKHGVFRTFSPGRKSAKVARQSTPELVRRPSSWTSARYEEVDSWIGPAGGRWQRFFDPEYGRYYWNLVGSSHSQWHPPWED